MKRGRHVCRHNFLSITRQQVLAYICLIQSLVYMLRCAIIKWARVFLCELSPPSMSFLQLAAPSEMGVRKGWTQFWHTHVSANCDCMCVLFCGTTTTSDVAVDSYTTWSTQITFVFVASYTLQLPQQRHMAFETDATPAQFWWWRGRRLTQGALLLLCVC